jgi:hypothetical protein
MSKNDTKLQPDSEKSSEKAPQSCIASSNVKIFMKLEDPTETYELFKKFIEESKNKLNE